MSLIWIGGADYYPSMDSERMGAKPETKKPLLSNPTQHTGPLSAPNWSTPVNSSNK